MSDALLPCPTCGETVPADDAFCEACGAAMAQLTRPVAPSASAAAPCATCGASADQIDADGYCGACGTRRVGGPRDHLSAALADVAAVTDRGRRQHRNEDAFARARQDGRGLLALVVCDGVSSSTQSDVAAQAAADAACRRLASVAADADAATREAAVGDAVHDAQRAVLAVPAARGDMRSAPACTFVGALVGAGSLTIGGVGDRRAYWLAGRGAGAGTAAAPLTVDHSWAAEQMAAGRPEAEVMTDPSAHAITRWLGADQPGDPAPGVRTLPVAAPGRLLLCSDGLWNVATDVEIAAAAAAPDLAAAADSLVAMANAAGGPDNITVILCEVPL